MNRAFHFAAALVILELLAPISCGWAAGVLTQQIDPQEVNVGEEVTVTIKVQNTGAGDIELPRVDGLQVAGRNTMSGITIDNGSFSSSLTDTFTLVPTRAGDFIIPGFDVQTHDGQLHVNPMKLHVLASGIAPANPTPSPTASAPATAVAPSPPGGPVVMPPGGTAQASTNAVTDANGLAPVDGEGRPVKVFLLITPQTTDAFVGESIPTRIEFFIRTDVDAPQDSLPTIQGSDFLMNNLSPRPQQDEAIRGGESYHRYAWITAISAPKNGDFPLVMQHDVYWAKAQNNMLGDPFANLFGRNRSLEHATIGSNALTMHVHTLPGDGTPADFSGAIGQFKVTGAAAPATVNIGEPVTLHFAVSGQGNFGYVKSPALVNDPAWKAYVPASKIEYEDESHTQAIKTFEQAVIPQRNGTLSLPACSFSYFDPQIKQYVSIPVPLPSIQVTGEMAKMAAVAPAAAEPAAPPPATLAGNRLETGTLFAELVPVYRQPWFWGAQGGVTLLALVVALFSFIRSRRVKDHRGELRALREDELIREVTTMKAAAQNQDAPVFFGAARRAILLRFALRWDLVPESVNLDDIREREPALAESMTPLFQQADEVIYSGRASSGHDLAQWEQRVENEWL